MRIAEAIRAAECETWGSFVAIAELPREPAERGAEIGPLVGMPFAAKDNLDTASLPTTANSPGLMGSRPRATHRVIEVLESSGARLIGKTNMHELALGITTNEAAFPATRNPRDPSCSAGGSSGGSAAAVAAGIVPFALGTDTGGSLSIPASWCGVVSFRPSTGRWPGDRVVPLSPTRDTVGVIAESLALVEQVDSVVCPRSARAAVDRNGAPIRIGIPNPESVFLSELADDVRAVWDASLARLADCTGLETVTVETDPLHRLEAASGAEIEFFEISHALEAYLAALPTPMSFQELRAKVARSDVGELLDESWRARRRAGEYRSALETRTRLQGQYRDLFAHHGLSAIAYPSVPVTATKVGVERCALGGATDRDIFAVGTRNVNPGSVAGQPAVSIPAGSVDDGLPVGISIEGARFADSDVIATAAAVAEALGAPGIVARD